MKTFLLLFTICLSLVSRAQVNESIKKGSDTNTDYGFGGYSSYSGSTDACFDLAMQLVYVMGYLNKNNQEYKEIKKEEGIYRVQNMEFTLNSGFLPNRYLVTLPHITVTDGMFAYDARMFHIREERLDKIDNYRTFDLQFQYNLVTRKYFNIRMGTGMMLETYSNRTFNEHSLRIDGYPGRFRLTAQGRLSPDYQTGLLVRQELDFTVSRNLLNEDKRMQLYANLHGMLAKYYEGVNVWTVGLGVTAVLPY